MGKWISIILQVITFLVGGFLIVKNTNWDFLFGLILFLWGNNLMVSDRLKEYPIDKGGDKIEGQG